MKKIFILLMLCLFKINLISAQSIKFGIKGGFNRSSINDEERVADPSVKPRPGFHFGGLVHFHLHKNWAFQPEIMYSKEGAKYENQGKSDLNYLNVPILIQYMRGPGFRIQTGPQVGLNLSAKYEDLNNNEFKKIDIQKGNFSWAGGFGYLTKYGIGFDARLILGFSNIYKKGFHPGQTAHTRAGQFGIFYQFN